MFSTTPSCLALLALALLCTGCAATTDSDTDPVAAVPLDVDPDKDTIVSAHEGDADPDEDRIPAFRDPDSDDDGLPDRFEAGDDDPTTLPFDHDGDQIPDFLDTDSDNNGLPDAGEGRQDTDGDGTPDAFDDDDDGDGAPDTLELEGTFRVDTDGDGTPDFRDWDSDDDGIADAAEQACAFVPGLCDTDGDGTPDFRDLDTDGDGLPDATEAGPDGRAPRDTDGDGTPDFRDLDSDGDGLSDAFEQDRSGTDPTARDSDGDGLADGVERTLGTDPLDADSAWPGWIITLAERTEREETVRFELGVQRLDVVVLYDQAAVGTSGPFARATVSELIERMKGRVADPTFAMLQVGGYSAAPYVGEDRRSAWLRDPKSEGCPAWYTDFVLSAPADAQNAADTLEVDPAKRECVFATAPYEAMVQLLEGPGRDDDCNGVYDPKWDTLPWRASSEDPFGGRAGQRMDEPGHPGVRAGFGFRPFARPIVLWFQAHQYTDPGARHPAPDHYINRDYNFSWIEPWPVWRATPEDCPSDADYLRAAKAIQGQRGLVLGINPDRSRVTPAANPEWSMKRFLTEVGEEIDLDGDGTTELPYIPGADFVRFVETGEDPVVTNALEAVLARIENEIGFDSVRIEVEGDTHGLVAEVDPARHTGLREGDALSFAVRFRGTVPALEHDQVLRLALNVLTDDDDLVARKDLVVVVPGTSR